ncbi:MAG: hypothetical protein FWH18_11050 [Marinilabiliaceae bacterium]|nr:hypothetical protein [Marinilabiliaceae bacterium]
MIKGKFFNSEAVANMGGAKEADTISKNGRNSKSQTSRGNFFRVLFFTILVSGVMFCSCDDNENNGNNGNGDDELATSTFDGTIIAKVDNFSEFNSVVRKVVVTLYGQKNEDEGTYEKLEIFGNLTNDGFTITFPQPLDDKYLNYLLDEWEFSTVTVSDVNVKANLVELYLVCYDSDDNLVGDVEFGNDEVYVEIAYLEKDVTITGQDRWGVFHSISWKKGWNFLYWIEPERGNSETTTKDPGGLKWYFDWYQGED